MPKSINSGRILVDPIKMEKLPEITGKTWRYLSEELGRSSYYLTGIKNRAKSHPADKYGVCSKNSLFKLEYNFLVGKYGYEFKLEEPVKPEPKKAEINKEVPVEQTDTYIAVYFGVLDALKDFYKEHMSAKAKLNAGYFFDALEMSSQERAEMFHKGVEASKKNGANTSTDEKKIISQKQPAKAKG